MLDEEGADAGCERIGGVLGAVHLPINLDKAVLAATADEGEPTAVLVAEAAEVGGGGVAEVIKTGGGDLLRDLVEALLIEGEEGGAIDVNFWDVRGAKLGLGLAAIVAEVGAGLLADASKGLVIGVEQRKVKLDDAVVKVPVAAREGAGTFAESLEDGVFLAVGRGVMRSG